MVCSNDRSPKYVKVQIRKVRIPTMGDKFSSRHGQKGTCGITLRQEDMPFNIDGIIPDMIVNPHCIPSRMTIGHLFESQATKIAAVRGDFSMDATPFTNYHFEERIKELHQLHQLKHGGEVMTSPYSGLMMGQLVFMGPTYYQRLKHIVQDKMYARMRGCVQAMTRQPTEGRRREGGLRFGEMERDCVLSYGMCHLMQEKMMFNSD